jgi:hypothetical protein
MKIIKLMALILSFSAISNCAVVTEADQESTGRIAFGVHSMALSRGSSPNGQGLAVAIYLTHDASGLTHEVNAPFKAGNRMVFLDNLPPGNYSATGYRFNHNFIKPYTNTLKPAISVKVVANQTSLFPQVVRMSEIYPGGGLSLMDNEAHWQSLIAQ